MTYDLPSIFSLFDSQMSKQEWKKILNDTVHSHIEAMWRADIGEKSSLKSLYCTASTSTRDCQRKRSSLKIIK